MLRFALPFRIAIAAALALATAACDINGIGKGTRPVSMEIIRATSLLDPESNRSYLCFTDQIRVIAYFNDDRQVGDFTARQTLKLTSSDTSVIEVSNGDIPVEGSETLVYSPGTLIPRGVGTATITAQFSDLSASYEVEVVAPQDISLSATRLALAPNTLAALTLTADIDGEDVNVTSAAAWSFVEEDFEDIALIGAATGVVAGVAPGTLTAKAVFSLCPSVAVGLEAEVEVSPVQSLLLTREFEDAPNDELVINTTDALKAVATLLSGDTQDLTQQVSYTSDVTDVLGTGAGAVVNLVRGIKEGTANVKATYSEKDPDPEDDDVDPRTVDSNSLPFTIVDDTLASIAITPDGITLAPGEDVQFTAEGTYTLVPTRKQMITRHVVWSSSDAEEVAIGNGVTSGGYAVGVKTTDEPVTITAKFTIGTGDDAPVIEKTVKVCVIPPEVEDDDIPAGCPARPTPDP